MDVNDTATIFASRFVINDGIDTQTNISSLSGVFMRILREVPQQHCFGREGEPWPRRKAARYLGVMVDGSLDVRDWDFRCDDDQQGAADPDRAVVRGRGRFGTDA
jgi:hypothetical protein